MEGFVLGKDAVQSAQILAPAIPELVGEPEPKLENYKDIIQGEEAVEAQAMPLALDALLGLAHLQAQAGEAEQALEYSLRVLNHSASTQEAKDRAEGLCARLVSQLTPRQVEHACADAEDLTIEAIVEWAEDFKCDGEEAMAMMSRATEQPTNP